MNCIKCGSKAQKNGFEVKGALKGIQKYRCTKCKYNFNEGQITSEVNPEVKKPAKAKIGMSLHEFREKHDVEYIVQKTLDKLNPTMVYEKNDIIKLTGLGPGYPGLSSTIEDAKMYYGKVRSILYFSHPDTIAELKEQAKLM